jgi:hypothetical protein
MPCYKATMEPVRKVIRREEILFFLRFHGLWEGIIQLPRPPPPPFDIDTMEPIEPPWQAMKERIAAASSWAAEITDNPTQAMLAWIIIFSILGSVGTLAGAVLMLFFLIGCRLTDQDQRSATRPASSCEGSSSCLAFQRICVDSKIGGIPPSGYFSVNPISRS